jgi:ABC-type lipoprotein export system ATPase subunit
MSNNPIEHLEINNFLSIKHLSWEVSAFNVITGDMGSGKSLCIKLLQFFEDIIPELLVLPYDTFLENLNPDEFYANLKDKFSPQIFYFELLENKSQIFSVNYTFSYGDNVIKYLIEGNGKGDIHFDSPSMMELLEEWKTYIQEKQPITPDGFEEVKLVLYRNLLVKFGNNFPIATIFVPASRASLAFNSNNDEFYLKEYNNLINAIQRFPDRQEKDVYSILKADIKIDKNVQLISKDGRIVPLSKASSGQQEIIYVISLLNKLGRFTFSYAKHITIFIEEPSAHLFPMEQKRILEFMVDVFNILNGKEKNSIRFVVTTHSPYVLNVINNMMKKGYLLNILKDSENKELEDEAKKLQFPHLYAEEVSAFFIEENGKTESMIQNTDRGSYLFDDKIEEITESIDNDFNSVKTLINKISG